MRIHAPEGVKLKPHQKRWLVVISSAVVVGLGLVLLFLLTQASDNRQLYERNYRQLFVLNVVVATLLMLVIAWLSLRLMLRLRQGKFGSRLLLKIAATFALVGLLPGLLIYSVSYQFVSRSIESWFDVKVEGALDAGLSLGRSTLDNLANDLGQKTRAATSQIMDLPDPSVGFALERLREQLSADDVIVWNTAGQALASAGTSRFTINPDRPAAALLKQVKIQGWVTSIDGLEEAQVKGNAAAKIRALALVPASGLGLLVEPRVLQVTKAIPPTLVANALAVVNGSAIDDLLDHALRRAVVTGTAEYRAKLEFPLADTQRMAINGAIVLQGNDVQVIPGTPRLAGARGQVNFSESAVAINGVVGQALGGEVRVDGTLTGFTGGGAFTGASAANAAKSVLGRIYSSRSRIISPFISRTGTIDLANLPSAHATAARRWLSTAKASTISRVNPYFVAIISAEIPCGTKYVPIANVGSTAIAAPSDPIATRLIISTPPAI